MSEFSSDELLFRQRSKQRDDYWLRSDKSEDEVDQLERKLGEALAEIERLKSCAKILDTHQSMTELGSRCAELESEVSRLREVVGYYELIQAERDKLLAEVSQLKSELYEVRVSHSHLDCRYTPGPYADSGGNHCPIDKPCERCRQESEVERLKKSESVLVNVLLEAGVIVNDGDEWVCKLCDASACTRGNIQHEDWCAFMEESGK